jgi:hypothetical protein
MKTKQRSSFNTLLPGEEMLKTFFCLPADAGRQFFSANSTRSIPKAPWLTHATLLAQNCCRVAQNSVVVSVNYC